ncbi:ArsR family transcriptional regulator [Algoriphagus sp. D3-2-R+10]|nr:ArsR family transcriptional regulator [Algoriphagus sp. D3-2-R+10]MEB2778345.1 ArsR family transcriptional regulator [Algoriphagus sp. D3-2-R+10]
MCFLKKVNELCPYDLSDILDITVPSVSQHWYCLYIDYKLFTK